MDYKTAMRNALKAARDIANVAQAQNRDLTDDEIDRSQAHLKEYEAAKAAYERDRSRDRSREGQDLKNQLKSISGGGPNADHSFTKTHSPAGIIRKGQETSAGFLNALAGGWAEKAAEAFDRANRREGGTKALTSGTIDVPSVLAEPVEISGRPTSLLELIPTRSATGQGLGNAFSYLRQTTRTNNAGAVPDNATKGTSVYTFGDVEDTFRVYAHLSEKFPKRYLDDYDGLIRILQNQMGAGLLEALEADVLTGAVQPADEFTGILNTSGTIAQPWTTDLITTLSNARYKLVNAFITPDAWVLNPTDVQRLELLREDGATGPFMFRRGLADIEERLGAPVVMSNLIPAGTGLVGDFSWTELIVREDDHLDVDTSGDKFEKNQVQFRLEGRYGFTVERPTAFVEVDLTSA